MPKLLDLKLFEPQTIRKVSSKKPFCSSDSLHPNRLSSKELLAERGSGRGSSGKGSSGRASSRRVSSCKEASSRRSPLDFNDWSAVRIVLLAIIADDSVCAIRLQNKGARSATTGPKRANYHPIELQSTG